MALLVIGWTVLFMWGWAYMMPIVPTVMFIAWTWSRGKRCLVPCLIAGAIIQAAYAMAPD